MSGAHAWVLIRQHDVRIANLEFGVANFPIRSIHAKQFGRSKNFLIVIDGLGSTLDDQVGRHSLVAFGDVRDFTHNSSPEIFRTEGKKLYTNAVLQRIVLTGDPLFEFSV
jgi:hypothetical protein